VLDFIPGTGPVTHQRQQAVGGPIQTWTADELQIVANQVCDRCNNGWMDRLEGEARPHLIPMIRGRPRYLHRRSQATLAAWATKTALALHLTTPEKAATQSHYREIASTHRAPAQTQVWIAGYQGRHAARHHSSQLQLTGKTLSADGYATTFSVSHVVFQVFGYGGIEEEVSVSKLGAWAQATFRIKPFVESFTWPPTLILDDAGFDAFAVVFESPE
jgi:hypothetical protein